MNNKVILSLLSGAFFAGSAYAGEVVAPVVTEPCFTGEVSVGAHSDYIWRGLNLGDALLDTKFEVSTSAWGLDFNGGLWSGFVTEGRSGSDELNVYAGVSKDLGWAHFNTGYIYYEFHANIPNGHEIYLGLSKDLCWGLNASYTYFLDVDGADNDGYNELVFDHETELFGESFDTTLTSGFLAENWGASHITLKSGYDIAITETATLTPYLAYTWELGGAERYALDGSQGDEKNRFYGGVSLSVFF